MSAYLTTTDNPYNPKTQFDAWYAWDVQMGYNTCAYLDRVATPTSMFATPDYAEAIEDAMNEIVQFNLCGKYIKIEIPDDDSADSPPPGGSAD